MLNLISIAFKSLLGNKVRAVLTLLGIIFGVTSVVIVLSTSEGIKNLTKEQYEKMGSNLVFVWGDSKGPRTQPLRFTLDDMEMLKGSCPSAKFFSPESRGNFTVSFERFSDSMSAQGITPKFFLVRKLEIESGQLFSDSDIKYKKRVVLLGSDAAKKIANGRTIIGKEIRINRKIFVVKGIMAEKGGWDKWLDESIYMPVTTLFQMTSNEEFGFFIAQANDEFSTGPLIEEMRLAFSRDRGLLPSDMETMLGVSDSGENLKSQQEFNHTIEIFLTVIGGISLFIGGIGIMNIMLVSVTERTREIGIRKAVGANEADIMLQFLIESVTLCLVGGALGIGLGKVGNTYLEKLPDFVPLALSPTTIMIAVFVSSAVGIVFGFWPAARAAKMNPIEALRHE